MHSLKFTVTKADTGVFDNIQTWWNSYETGYRNKVNVPYLSNPNLKYPNCVTYTEWQIVANLVFAPLNIDPSRLCNVTYVKTEDSVKFMFNIIPPLSSPPATIALLPENMQKLNALSANCLGPWIKAYLIQYRNGDSNTQPSIYYQNTIANLLETCKIDNFTPTINHNIEKYTNSSYQLVDNIKFTDVSIENYDDISGNSGLSIMESPTTVWEYLFMFAYFFSFVGAIFYGVTYIVNIDPTYVITNKTAALAINLYIAACSIVSIFVWFNMPNPILDQSMLNPNTVKYTVN
jgi:hypothetical protein